MAKYRAKKAGAGVALARVIAVIIIAALMVGSGYGLGCALTGKTDVRQWGKETVLPDEPPALEEGSFELDNLSTSGTAKIEAGESTGIAFKSNKLTRAAYSAAGVPAEADTAFTLTATIQPEYATNKSVDWTIAFNNPAATWANGKTVTDFMTVTPAEDGALTATAVCKKSFAEQIKITVTSRDNAQIKAHCIVNYEEKITDVHLTLCGGEVDKTSLVGTWQLGDPSSSGFQYACTFLGGNSYLGGLVYATSEDYTEYGFRYKSLFGKSTSSSLATGLWFAYSSSPDWSIDFSDYTETYKDFYLYIKSADESQSSYANFLSTFNKGLFTKVSDNVGLDNTDQTEVTSTLYGGSSYNFDCDIVYSEYTVKREVSLMSSVCGFGLVENFCELIGVDRNFELSYPQNNLILSPSFNFDIVMLAKMLNLPSDCFETETNEQGDKVVNENGKEILSEIIDKIKENGAGVNLAYLKVNFLDTNGNSFYERTYYFALNAGTLSIPVEDIIISDTEITI